MKIYVWDIISLRIIFCYILETRTVYVYLILLINDIISCVEDGHVKGHLPIELHNLIMNIF